MLKIKKTSLVLDGIINDSLIVLHIWTLLLKKFTENLSREAKIQTIKYMKEVRGFNDSQIDLMLQKEVFFYDYFDCSERLNETSLPLKKEFCNKLNDTGIKDEDYMHALTVWNDKKNSLLTKFSILEPFSAPHNSYPTSVNGIFLNIFLYKNYILPVYRNLDIYLLIFYC